MDVTGLARLGQNQLWKYVVSIDFVLAFSFHSPLHFHSATMQLFLHPPLLSSSHESFSCLTKNETIVDTLGWHAMPCITGTSGGRQHWQLRESMKWKNWAIWVKMDRNLEPAIHTLSDDWSRPWNVLRWEKQCWKGSRPPGDNCDHLHQVAKAGGLIRG